MSSWPSLKYAHIEAERRFLLAELPPTWRDTPALTIFDRYLSGTRLRLRKVEANAEQPTWKLGQKVRLSGQSPGRVAHTTLLGLASAPSIELASKLVEVAPAGLSRVFYSDSGSTAVEVAMKMAFQYWRQKGRPEKRGFVALDEAYHGDTLGAVSAGGIELFHEIFRELLFSVARIPTPYRSSRWCKARRG